MHPSASRNRNTKLFNLLYIALIVLLGACYARPRYDLEPREQRYGNSRDETESFERFPETTANSSPLERAKPLPWEAWTNGRDLGGLPIKNPHVLKGDAYVAEGLRVKALEEYKRINLNTVSAQVRAASIYRIAAMQLALDKAKHALKTLGNFFEKSHAKVEDVDPRFSLLFAYAFGHAGDTEQAFAWFSRVHRLGAGVGGISGAAEQGARALARSIPDENYPAVVRTWNSDTFVHSVLGQESRRRSSGGIRVAAGSTIPFWQNPEVTVVRPTLDDHVPGSRTLAVLLPLSGRYAKLGQATKNGIDLALEGSADAASVNVRYMDTAGDTVQAAALVQELSFEKHPPVILGPLLAETAITVADLARQKKLPVLTLTKNRSFVAGDAVFRLGPTVESQVETLIEAAYENKGIRKFAFVYSDSPQSREFIEVARTLLSQKGIAPVYETAFAPSNYAAFSQISTELSAQDVQAVFFPDGIEAVTRFRFLMPEDLRRNLLLLGTAKWDVPDELRRSRQAMEGVMFVSPFFVFSDNPYIKQFQETYKAKYSSSADFLAAQGFDAATMLLAALKKSNQSGQALEAALMNLALYEGLTGQMTVQASGEIQRRFTVVELKKNGLEKISVQKKPVDSMRGQYDFR